MKRGATEPRSMLRSVLHDDRKEPVEQRRGPRAATLVRIKGSASAAIRSHRAGARISTYDIGLKLSESQRTEAAMAAIEMQRRARQNSAIGGAAAALAASARAGTAMTMRGAGSRATSDEDQLLSWQERKSLTATSVRSVRVPRHHNTKEPGHAWRKKLF